MPMMAASTPSMSLTCGRRMKLAIPVKRGAFIASTGRYRGLPPPLSGDGRGGGSILPPPLAREPMSSGSRDFPRGPGRGGGSGTGQLRLNRLHALFVDDADHLIAQLGEP